VAGVPKCLHGVKTMYKVRHLSKQSVKNGKRKKVIIMVKVRKENKKETDAFVKEIPLEIGRTVTQKKTKGIEK